MTDSLYLWLNVLTLAGPLVRSFEPRVSFRSRWSSSLPSIALVALLFVAWDALFTWLGVWGFNSRYLVGLSALGLPIEEWLFFLTVPYACLFSYDCLNYFFPTKSDANWSRLAALGLAVTSAVLAIVYSDRLYTVAACALSAVCMFGAWRVRPSFLAAFIRLYLVSLVPFFLVNGILTGAVTDEPIVWYDDAENVGIRLFTIPVEDAFYLLALLWLNVSLYEMGARRKRAASMPGATAETTVSHAATMSSMQQR
jgi:lycopene cyclase domain-containing protein